MSRKQNDAINALDVMLHNLNKSKLVPYKEVIVFYQELEKIYDDKIDELEDILLQEIDDEEKFKQLKKISKLLEVNIF